MLTRTVAQVPDKLTLTIEASDASPIVDPAIVIKTGEKDQLVWISKASHPWGKDFRMGYVHRLDGTDLMMWNQRQSERPLHLQVVSTGSTAGR